MGIGEFMLPVQCICRGKNLSTKNKVLKLSIPVNNINIIKIQLYYYH